MISEKEEILIREMMDKSHETMPFPDFEDKLMERISTEAGKSKSWLRDVKLSWFFLLVGTLLGFVISLILRSLDEPVYGIPPQRILFIAESLFVVLLLSQFDKLIELTKNKWQ
jgi:hypothetical protein